MKQVTEIRQELASLKDPKNIKNTQQKLFHSILGPLQSFRIYNPIPKKGNAK